MAPGARHALGHQAAGLSRAIHPIMDDIPKREPLTEDRLAAIEARLERGSERMDDLTNDVLENTRVTQEVRQLTQEIRDLFEMGKTGMRVLNWIGRAVTRLVRWIGWMAAAGVAIWAAIYALFHGGRPPT